MANAKELTIRTSTADETIRIGASLGVMLQDGDTVLLDGDLGAGKTQLAKGVAVGLGVAEDIISPTFNLLIEHEGTHHTLYHFDLYRLDDPNDLEDIDFYYLTDATTPGVSLIEWSQRFSEEMPDDRLQIHIDKVAADADDASLRELRIQASGKRSTEILDTLRKEL